MMMLLVVEEDGGGTEGRVLDWKDEIVKDE